MSIPFPAFQRKWNTAMTDHNALIKVDPGCAAQDLQSTNKKRTPWRWSEAVGTTKQQLIGVQACALKQ